MRRCRVSSFFAEVTQQIHSFRASGVMDAHSSRAARSPWIARRRSAGNRWGVPPGAGERRGTAQEGFKARHFTRM